MNVVPVNVDDFAQVVAKLLVMRETIDDALALLERASGRTFRDLTRGGEQSLTQDAGR